jgi:Electron transfer DM13
VREFYRKHRSLVWAVAALVVAGAVFVVVWFEPHKLLIEETVDEPVPTVGAPASDDTASPDAPTRDDARESEPSEPKVLAMGSFQSLEHSTSGTAKILELPDGSLYLRFEDLDTSNGPDLRVYLSEIPASDDWHAYGERYLDLGALTGNRGSQNYVIPDDTDLARFKSAVVWCRRFTVGFGVAALA